MKIELERKCDCPSNRKKLPSILCFNSYDALSSILGWMKNIKQRSLLIHPGPGSFKFKMEKPLERHPCPCLPVFSDKPFWEKKACPLEGQALHPIDLLSFTVCSGSFLADDTSGRWQRENNNSKIHPKPLAGTWPFQVIKINNYLSHILGSLFPVKWIWGEKNSHINLWHSFPGKSFHN